MIASQSIRLNQLKYQFYFKVIVYFRNEKYTQKHQVNDEFRRYTMYFTDGYLSDTFGVSKKLDGYSSLEDSINFFMSDNAKISPTEQELEIRKIEEAKAIEKASKKTSRKKSTTSDNIPTVVDTTQMPAVSPAAGSVVSYATSYDDTTNMLRQAIMQADVLTSEIKQDIDTIRASKTMKGKYTYITNLASTEAGLIGTKISAIREMNNSITQAHNLELKRAKDIKDDQRNQQSDDARIMDMYNAFINAPIGSYAKPTAPSIPDILLGANGPSPAFSPVAMVGTTVGSSNLTPEQMRIRYEGNPNVEEVVMYEASTGRIVTLTKCGVSLISRALFLNTK